MKRTLSILAVMTSLLAACASSPDLHRMRLETLPQRYSQFDLVMAWETRNEGDRTVIEGVARNVRYYMMRDLEIWVRLLDREGKVAARAMTFIIPSDLGLDQSAPFAVTLPVAVTPGDRLRFTYRYRGSDGGDGLERGIDWMQSFESVVPAGQ